MGIYFVNLKSIARQFILSLKRNYTIILAILWKFQGYPIVHVLGDSHAEVFLNMNKLCPDFAIKFDVCYVHGATISGIENPNSKTCARTIFLKRLTRIQKGSIVLLALGEVDCGFLIWHKHQETCQNLNEIYKLVIEKYFNFIEHILFLGMEVIVLSSPLPTIEDNSKKGEVANLRKDIIASKLARTALTVKFNKEVEKWCKSKYVENINLDMLSIDPFSSLVKKELLSECDNDHHYSTKAYINMIKEAFPKHFFDNC